MRSNIFASIRVELSIGHFDRWVKTHLAFIRVRRIQSLSPFIFACIRCRSPLHFPPHDSGSSLEDCARHRGPHTHPLRLAVLFLASHRIEQLDGVVAERAAPAVQVNLTQDAVSHSKSVRDSAARVLCR
jgi:hypothetical protein